MNYSNVHIKCRQVSFIRVIREYNPEKQVSLILYIINYSLGGLLLCKSTRKNSGEH